jgi:hypothetical protein
MSEANVELVRRWYASLPVCGTRTRATMMQPSMTSFATTSMLGTSFDFRPTTQRVRASSAGERGFPDMRRYFATPARSHDRLAATRSCATRPGGSRGRARALAARASEPIELDSEAADAFAAEAEHSGAPARWQTAPAQPAADTDLSRSGLRRDCTAPRDPSLQAPTAYRIEQRFTALVAVWTSGMSAARRCAILPELRDRRSRQQHHAVVARERHLADRFATDRVFAADG